MSFRMPKRQSASTRSSVSSGGSGVASPGRATSPTRTSRQEEKDQLVGLNDRLAAYIDKVKSLELENSRLTRQVRSTQETVTREVSNVKTLYEQELKDARSLLDVTALEKAQLQIEICALKPERDELVTKLTCCERELDALKKSTCWQEGEIQNLNGRLIKTINDKKKVEGDLKNTELELQKTKKQLDDARKLQEKECLERINSANQCQSLKEQLEFNTQLHEKQLTETRSRRTEEITEIDGRLHTEYESRLQASLQELRDQYEAHMKANRDEVEAIYELKISELGESLARNQQTAASTLKELREGKVKIEGLQSRITELDGVNNALLARIRDLEKQLDDERADSANLLAAKDDQIRRLEHSMQDQMKEYSDLMDLKVALDVEIATYRKLLESEEARLQMSPGRSQASSGFGSLSSTSGGARTPSKLRKRTFQQCQESASTSGYSVSASSNGDVLVEDVGMEHGKFVVVSNSSNREVTLGGMRLVRQAGSRETEYKFHRCVKLAAGERTTVWSADWASQHGISHQPPHVLVMKGRAWCLADEMSTTLLNTDGEEVSKLTSKRQNSSSFNSRQMPHNQPDSPDESNGSDNEWSFRSLFSRRRSIR